MLYQATAKGHLAVMEELLQAGVDVNDVRLGLKALQIMIGV